MCSLRDHKAIERSLDTAEGEKVSWIATLLEGLPSYRGKVNRASDIKTQHFSVIVVVTQAHSCGQ